MVVGPKNAAALDRQPDEGTTPAVRNRCRTNLLDVPWREISADEHPNGSKVQQRLVDGQNRDAFESMGVCYCRHDRLDIVMMACDVDGDDSIGSEVAQVNRESLDRKEMRRHRVTRE